MRTIIGLIGAKGAGKTTAFKIMNEVVWVDEITLAGKLKDVCSSVFSIPRDHFDDHRFKEKESDAPVFLNSALLAEIHRSYDLKMLDYDKYIRPHIGIMLYTPRQIAQYIGTEVLRAVDINIHCKAALRTDLGDIGIVTDMRFLSEFDYFATLPDTRFLPVYIKNQKAELYAAKDTHASEKDLPVLARKAIMTLSNETTIKVFEDNVRSYIQEVLK